MTLSVVHLLRLALLAWLLQAVPSDVGVAEVGAIATISVALITALGLLFSGRTQAKVANQTAATAQAQVGALDARESEADRKLREELRDERAARDVLQRHYDGLQGSNDTLQRSYNTLLNSYKSVLARVERLEERLDNYDEAIATLPPDMIAIVQAEIARKVKPAPPKTGRTDRPKAAKTDMPRFEAKDGK